MKKAIALTVAHLDHNQANGDRQNLRASCAPCHPAYDRPQHIQTSASKAYQKREPNGQLGVAQLEWRQIAGLRHILAHAYFRNADETIWDIVQNIFLCRQNLALFGWG